MNNPKLHPVFLKLQRQKQEQIDRYRETADELVDAYQETGVEAVLDLAEAYIAFAAQEAGE